MPPHHAGGKTQSLLCAPTPPSYTERFPTSLQPAPHQTHPEGSDAPGQPHAPRPSVPDGSRGRDAQGQRGGGCGSATVLPRSPAPGGRAGTPHQPGRSRHGPGDSHPDPAEEVAAPRGGAGDGPDPRPRCSAAMLRSPPGPAAPRSGRAAPQPAPAGSAPPTGGTGAPRGGGGSARPCCRCGAGAGAGGRGGEGRFVPLPGLEEPPRCCGAGRGRAARVPPSPPRHGRDKAPPAVRPRGAGLCLPGPGSGRPPARSAPALPCPAPPRSVPVPVPVPYGTCWPGAGCGAASPPAAWCCPRQRGPAGRGREGRWRRDRPALSAP